MMKIWEDGVIRDATPEELAQAEKDRFESKKRRIDESRNKRNQLLTATDWTQIADAPVDKAAWATYRQALRDIPQQEGFPDNIIWPTQPE